MSVRTDRFLTLALVVALALAATMLTGVASASHDVTPARVAGETRIDTAAQVAALMFPQGTDQALVAQADEFPDALAAAALAGELSAPVLLVHTDELPQPTRQQLDTLGVQEVVIVGGPSSVSPEVEQQLEQLYPTVVRVAGETRFGTAAEIAREIVDRGGRIGATPGGQRSAFLANGFRFPDALAAGAPAYAGPNPFPILLTAESELPEPTRAAIQDVRIEQVLIVGGEAVVSSQVAQELEQMGLNVVRIAGPTRTATATRIADFAVQYLELAPTRTTLARSDTFADSLAAGPLAGSLGGPLLLTQPNDLAEPTRTWLAEQCPDVAVVRAVGGTVAISTAVLNAAEQAAQSCHPTQRNLAYSERTDQGPVLVVSDLEGQSQVVAEGLAAGGSFDWSPDAAQLAYQATGADLAEEDIHKVPAAGGESVSVTSGPEDDEFPTWARTDRIAFTRGPQREPFANLYTISPDGAALQQLTSDTGFDPLFPDWSPDGTQVVFERFNREVDPQRPGVWVINQDGTGLRELSEGLAEAVRPAWSPDGQWIAFEASTAPTEPKHLYVVRPDGSDRRRLTDLVTDLSEDPWAPDGGALAFGASTSRGAGRDIYVIGVDGTGQALLADARQLDGSPTWSPDGSTIAFVGATAAEGGESDIFLVDADGGNLRQLTNTGTAEQPVFAPR